MEKTFPVDVQKFSFETVRVNERGELTERLACQARRLVETVKGVGLELVQIPTGSYHMGSQVGQGFEDERPQHFVNVPSFWLARHPITQEVWQAVMGSLPPCRTKGPKNPVDRVSWHQAQEFCHRLSRQTGRDYRLPAETEWEYACRAGTNTPFCYGETITTDLANYVGDHVYGAGPVGVYRHGSSPVGSFPPNAFGVCDMHGNVWEWCADAWYDDYIGAGATSSSRDGSPDSARVLRGGCWHDTPNLCRSASRLKSVPTEAEDFFGFRVTTMYRGDLIPD